MFVCMGMLMWCEENTFKQLLTKTNTFFSTDQKVTQSITLYCDSFEINNLNICKQAWPSPTVIFLAQPGINRSDRRPWERIRTATGSGMTEDWRAQHFLLRAIRHGLVYKESMRWGQTGEREKGNRISPRLGANNEHMGEKGSKIWGDKEAELRRGDRPNPLSARRAD